MISAILLRRKRDAIARREMKRIALRQPRNGIIRRVSAAPDLMRLPAHSIAHPNRPRLRANRNYRQPALRPIRFHVRDLASISRPSRQSVAVHAWLQIAQRLLPEIVNRNQTMIPAIAGERDFASIRRPLRLRIVSANIAKLLRRLRARNRSDP